MTISPLRVFLAVIFWLAVMLALMGYYLWSWLHESRMVPNEHQELVVERGDSLNQIASLLHEKGVLRWPRIWSYYARLFESEPIKAGEYLLPEQTSPLAILHQLQAGEVVTYAVTLVEGRTFADMLQVLHGQEKLEHELLGLSEQEILDRLGLDLSHPEGWFFPDTYHFIAGDSDVDLLLRAHNRMRHILELEWRARAAGLPYQTPYEALIMASIIEKETGVAHERDEIAGVFVRRLARGMRLQTDPTVIYGLGQSFDGNLRRTDLTNPTPYNTYTRSGLPPTPIAMPGREAIEAALHPKSGSALYFVARGDGTHVFSATLEEHLQAVRKFQKRERRSDYRSAPPVEAPAEEAQEAQQPADTSQS